MPSLPCPDAEKHDEIMNSLPNSALSAHPPWLSFISADRSLPFTLQCFGETENAVYGSGLLLLASDILKPPARRCSIARALGISASSCCVTARPLLQQTCHWPPQLGAKPTDHPGPASRWLISKSNYRCWLKSLQPRPAWGRTLLGYCLGGTVAK